MARSSPYVSISGCNRAIQDTWRANLAAKAPFSHRGPGNHAWREDVATAARPFEAPRRGSRARELAERALCPAARAWSACRIADLCHSSTRAVPTRLPSRRHPPCHPSPPFARLRRTPTLPLLARPHSSPPPFTSRPRPPPALPVTRSSRAPPAFRAHRARRADFAASSKRAELHAQLNAGIKMGSPNGDPIK